MVLVSRYSDFAIQALCYLAEKDVSVSVSMICSQAGLPRASARSVLQTLASEGFVISTRGRDGGFRLARAPKDITLLDIVSVFQGPLQFTHCSLRKKCCPRQKNCGLRKRIEEIQKLATEHLRLTTIADLV